MKHYGWTALLAMLLIGCNSAEPASQTAAGQTQPAPAATAPADGMPPMDGMAPAAPPADQPVIAVDAQGLGTVSVQLGKTFSLLPSLTGALATAKDRVWATDTGGVASVNQDGLVQAWYPGTANISVSSKSSAGASAIFAVTVTAAAAPAASPPPAAVVGVGAQPALLKDYRSMTTVQVQGKPFQQADYSEMVYRPRQFAPGLLVDLHNKGAAAATVASAGSYAGWDALVTPNDPSNSVGQQSDWLVLHLNRPATLAVVWRSQFARPAWMQDWKAQGSVGLNVNGSVQSVPVYVKNFAAGEVKLGRDEAPAPNGANVYFVLLGEQNGSASAAPSTPAGQPVPLPNTACPAWVHDTFVAKGPDGKTYPTWHPQIDPRYWCTFGHEHGSDPNALGGTFKPLYGYTAGVDGMSEPHVGFKTYTFKNASTGRVWVMTQHMGTAGQGRACTRYHTLDVAVLDGGTLKADLHLMGDFGRGQVFTASGIQSITGCPTDQNAISNRGVRVINTSDGGGYEPWVVDDEYNITGFFPGFMSFKTRDFIARCADQACKTVVTRPGQYGAGRILDYGDLWVKAGNHTSNSGVFYTNTLADKFVAAGSAMSVKQYVEPGFSDVMAKPADPGGFCGAFDTWQNVYDCTLPIISPMNNLEGGLTQNN
jgi:Bacterial Ig-like domain (group 2)